MDDFERELTRMMRDTRQPAPFRSEHQERLYAGIRVRRRSRMLWRAGGSALAVAGLSVGLALLPGTGSRSLPADRGPLPVTGPTPPPVSPTTTSVPSPDPSFSRPPTHTSGTTDAATTAPGYRGTPTTLPPTTTPGTTGRATTAPPPSPSAPPATTPAW
ncbi:cellulase [Streptomyces sp. NPDC018955]|uniref:cellulase n=1 Tax=Streptomyces sp. NPDC018955 TaxID=3365055 RepID=UPI0037B1CBFA